jgi:hypothetical protein
MSNQYPGYMPQRRKTAHFLHFIGAALTGGLWILPWIIFTMYNASYNQKLDLAMIAAGQNYRYKPQGDNRPIRTPDQIAAEGREKSCKIEIQNRIWAACGKVDSAPPTNSQVSEIASSLYDAGYRKFEIVDN